MYLVGAGHFDQQWTNQGLHAYLLVNSTAWTELWLISTLQACVRQENCEVLVRPRARRKDRGLHHACTNESTPCAASRSSWMTWVWPKLRGSILRVSCTSRGTLTMFPRKPKERQNELVEGRWEVVFKWIAESNYFTFLFVPLQRPDGNKGHSEAEAAALRHRSRRRLRRSRLEISNCSPDTSQGVFFVVGCRFSTQ